MNVYLVSAMTPFSQLPCQIILYGIELSPGLDVAEYSAVISYEGFAITGYLIVRFHPWLLYVYVSAPSHGVCLIVQ